jgi:hypothetical protein
VSNNGVFYPLLRPLSIAVYPEDFKQLTEFARQEMKAKTVNQHMSDASLGFAKDLLVGRNISVLVDEANTEVGLGKDPTPYCWTFLALDLVVKKKGEHDGTPGARDWFYEHFLLGTKYNLKVVTGTSLPKIEGDQKSATGKADIQIGFQEQMELETSPFDQAHGLIELKTNVYPLKPGQNILELASLSTISRFGKGVALLATDCNEKWELCYFQDSKTIKRRAYRHGRKCVEDFKELLDSADGRPQEPPPSRRRKQNLPSMDEEGDGGQNLDGFDDGDGKTKALENHVMLNALANQLADIYGERPVVPEWARAENTCPDYYV